MPSTNGRRISRTNQSAIASTTSTPTQKRAGRLVMDSYAHGSSSPSTFIGALEMRIVPANECPARAQGIPRRRRDACLRKQRAEAHPDQQGQGKGGGDDDADEERAHGHACADLHLRV